MTTVPENPKFAVISKLDNRALEIQEDDSLQMKTYDANNERQQWIKSDLGNQWINVGTGRSFRVGDFRSCRLSEYDNGYLILNDRNPKQCLDRFWTQVEGKVVWYSNHIHGKPTQRFDIVYLF